MSNQERRLMRRMRSSGCGSLAGPFANLRVDLAEQTAQEQDYRRNNLAEQVLLEMVETVTWTDSDDEMADREKAIEAMRTAAHAALAAAEVIYPEIPESGEAQRRHDLGLPVDMPAAAQEGARAVAAEAPSAEVVDLMAALQKESLARAGSPMAGALGGVPDIAPLDERGEG